jgi:hypothetical protein
MRRPGGTFVGLDVDKHANARRRQRRSIEVKQAAKLGKRRQLGVEAGVPTQIQSEFGLGQKLVPQEM